MATDCDIALQLVENIKKLQAELYAHRLLLGQWEELASHPQLQKTYQISAVFDGLHAKQKMEVAIKFQQLEERLRDGTSASELLKALRDLV